jgi:hypothetical protein
MYTRVAAVLYQQAFQQYAGMDIAIQNQDDLPRAMSGIGNPLWTPLG